MAGVFTGSLEERRTQRRIRTQLGDTSGAAKIAPGHVGRLGDPDDGQQQQFFLAGLGPSLQPTGFAASLFLAQTGIQPFSRGGALFNRFGGAGRPKPDFVALQRQLAGRQTEDSLAAFNQLGLLARLGKPGRHPPRGLGRD